MILICYGTRPEWLKIKPIIDKLNRDEYHLLFTGQHTDLATDMPYDTKMTISEDRNRLDAIISQVLNQFPDGYEVVMVQGDTASAFACALAGFNRKMCVVHLEAGLRSNYISDPYPEEGYRQMISRIANVHFCPTNDSYKNLMRESIDMSSEQYITGNTSLDNLLDYKETVTDNKKVLVTMHRRENHYIIDEWFRQINSIAMNHPELEFIIPLHPNPNVTKWKHLLTNVTIVKPMEHKDLLNLMCECTLIITDSGGIQEEGSFLNKKVIVTRYTTERKEGIYSGHLFLCKSPDKLQDMFEEVLTKQNSNKPCPFGNGYASNRIVDILRAIVNNLKEKTQ